MPNLPLGNGDPKFCNNCEEPYREIHRLPGNTVGYCVTCFEDMLNGEL